MKKNLKWYHIFAVILLVVLFMTCGDDDD